MVAMLKSFIISSINPKFNNFNRPLLLSLLVGAAVVGGIVCLYLVEVSKVIPATSTCVYTCALQCLDPRTYGSPPAPPLRPIH